MRRENKIYHLCNIPSKVIFRNDEDYLIAICRMAACAYVTSTEIWAYSFMSTHFHIVAKSENLSGFIKLLKINISIWHNRKYKNSIKIDIGKRELLNEFQILTAVNYVLKNPIHHKIEDTAFCYPYSSAHLYYKENIYPREYFKGERNMCNMQQPSNLRGRIYRKLFASHKVPDTYLVMDEKFILPSTFVKVRTIENLYSSVRNFMYQMNKPLQEELEMFDSEKNYQQLDASRGSLFGKLTDMQVCKIVDDFLFPRPYTQITLNEKLHLMRILEQKGADKFQIERIL